MNFSNLSSRVGECKDKLIIILAILIAHLVQFINLHYWGKGALFCLFIASLMTRSWKTIACTSALFLMSLYGLLAPSYLNGAPIIGFLIPFLFVAPILYFFPHTHFNLQWFKKGSIDRVSWVLVFLTSILSTGALVLWAFWTNNLGIGEQFVRGFGPASNLLIFGVYIPLFALLNAFAEEVIYRGFIQESVSQIFKSSAVILFLQASAFAAVHFSTGFPNGAVGYFMVLAYGTMLGYLRMRTRGILAPYLAHVFADATIAALLVYLVK